MSLKTPTPARTDRLAEMVAHLTSCSHIEALDAVEQAEKYSKNRSEALAVVAAALARMKPTP